MDPSIGDYLSSDFNKVIPMSTLTALFHEYAAYDLWANTRFVERLEREPDEILDTVTPNSFPSLRKTILHIRDAENAWMCRLKGAPVPWPAEETVDLGGLLRVSKQLHDLVLGYDEAALITVHGYHTLKGDPQRSIAWRMLHHCFNHSTQHRGQLITMMRAIGLGEIPATDLIVYQRTLTT